MILPSPVVKSPIPAVYARYAGQETVWPEGRTSGGFVNDAKARQDRADAARANDARHRAYRAASQGTDGRGA